MAEDPDVRFLDFVSQYNVPYVCSANVIETGHMVCQMMSNNPHTRTVLDIQEMLATSTGITLRQAAAITTVHRVRTAISTSTCYLGRARICHRHSRGLHIRRTAARRRSMNARCRGRRWLHRRERAGCPAAPCIRHAPAHAARRAPGGLCGIGRRMIIVGHARCQVIEGSEIEYPSAVRGANNAWNRGFHRPWWPAWSRTDCSHAGS